jgi:hypothetical protein
MKTWLSSLTAIVILFISIAHSQSVYDQEIITMFEEGSVKMPLGLQEAYIDDVIFVPSELKTTLLNHTAETISLVFPDHDPSDSLLESPRFPGVFVKQPRLDLIYRIRLQDATQRDQLNDQLILFPQVYFSEKNASRDVCFYPNDTEFYRQWGMHSDTANIGVEDADIDAPEAWDLTQGNSATVIGIIDKGVYQNHIEFQGRISGEDHGYENDDHGTHVAGIAAAEGNNEQEGIAGVTWNSLIYSKDVTGWDEGDIYNSIIDAVFNHGAAVLNLSWGDDEFHIMEHFALAMAHDAGVLVVAARGNNVGNSPFYPACNYSDYVLSVGAFDHLIGRSNFSGWGVGLDILAPGGTQDQSDNNDIYSTSYGTGEQYVYKFGTSMAAPHVAGLVGLLDSYNGLPAYGSNLYQVITRSADNLFEPGYDELSGYGKLNARAALDLIGRPNTIYSPCSDNDHGPYLGSVSDFESWMFIGCPGLINGVYITKSYEVLYNAFFTDCDLIDEYFNETPVVWGIDHLTTGWAYENPNGGTRYCDVVDAGFYYVTLRTYVYELWDSNFEYLGFFPDHWQNCTFAYTVVADATPAPPHSLTISASPDYHPFIEWQPSPSNNVVSYSIYRMVHGIEDDWVYIGSVPVPANSYQYEDVEYSTPHSGPMVQWIDDADYTVTAVNEYGDESHMPPFVTIKVVVPEYPDPKPYKQSSPTVEIPVDYSLYAAYPNPFNSSTTIRYALPEDSYTIIEIFNVSGQKIETLLDETRPAGYHELVWDASHVASGTYFYKINAGDFSDSKMITLLK